jgi:hypothetical protein
MGLGGETLAQLDPEVREYIDDLYRLALLKRFSRSSEQSLKGQEDLFDGLELLETSPESSDTEETITVREHEKRKPGRKRKPIDPKHPRHEVRFSISWIARYTNFKHESSLGKIERIFMTFRRLRWKLSIGFVV